MHRLRLAAIAGTGAPTQAVRAIHDLERETEVAALPTRWLASLTERVELLSLADDVAAAARVAALTVWAANQQVIDRALAIGAAFAVAGVRAVALKGIGVLDAYPSAAHRPLGDLDLLVAPADLERATEELRTLGHPIAHDLSPYLLRQRHAVIAPARDGVVVDLHWRASGGLPDVRSDGGEPWPLSRAIQAPPNHPLHESGLLVLTAEDNLAVVAVHGCRPGNERAVHLAADAHRLLGAHPEFDAELLLASLAEVGHRGRAVQWLQRVADDFGTELPATLSAPVVLSAEERLAARLERFATAGTRRGGSGRVRLAASVLAGSLSVTLTRPWRFPLQVIDRVRWELSSARSAAKAAAGQRDDE